MTINSKLNDIYNILIERKVDPNNICIITGDPGILLFCLHYCHFINDEKYLDVAIDQIEKYLESISIENVQSSLCNGLAGFAWLIEHIEQMGWIEINTNEILQETDELLHLRASIIVSTKGNYDLLYGGVGIGLYFLYRLKKTQMVKPYIEVLVRQLLELSVTEEDGCIRWNSFDIGNSRQNDHECNLGLAHGIPALLMFFVKVYNNNILKDDLLPIIKGIVKFILKHQLDFIACDSYFPHLVVQGINEKSQFSRLAWCYGDIGVCCSLWKAAEALQDDKLKLFVINVMTNAARKRNSSETGVNDASFCHGSSGLAFIFQRFFDWTKDSILEDAADYWYKITLDIATFQDGFAGYKTYRSEEYGGWTSEIGVLEGISGIGLSLLYKESGLDPSWEELLFIR